MNFVHTIRLFVSHDFQSKQQLFRYTALIFVMENGCSVQCGIGSEIYIYIYIYLFIYLFIYTNIHVPPVLLKQHTFWPRAALTWAVWFSVQTSIVSIYSFDICNGKVCSVWDRTWNLYIYIYIHIIFFVFNLQRVHRCVSIFSQFCLHENCTNAVCLQSLLLE